MLWRSQGEGFLDEQAAALVADIDRMREAYAEGDESELTSPKPGRKPRRAEVIDLRDEGVSGLACSRESHSNLAAAARCSNCQNAYCADCVVRPEGTDGEALCTECALVLGGVHRKRSPPARRPGRPGRASRR